MSAPISPSPAPRRRSLRIPTLGSVVATLHRWAESGWAGPAVGIWGLLQSSICPGPADTLFAPLGIVDQKRVPALTVWTTVGAIAGGVIAYGIGAFAFHLVGGFVLNVLDVSPADMIGFERSFASKGWIVIVIGALPLMSSKLVAYAAGAIGFPFWTYVLVWSVVRAVRSIIVGAMLYFGGPRVQEWLQRASVQKSKKV